MAGKNCTLLLILMSTLACTRIGTGVAVGDSNDVVIGSLPGSAIDETDKKYMSEASRRKYENKLGYNITDLSVVKGDFMSKGYDGKKAEQKTLGAIQEAGFNNRPLSDRDATYLKNEGFSDEFIAGLSQWRSKLLNP